ncbi:ChrR family anti-sigma-E factor [Marinobacter sp. LV10MA510-1]|uniref:ChrR family anti-sigma-E factor n=1 Tax=Marinobacter sp. LV10MA510-1 TaxID=1415567 RepID=UPI000BFA20E7|nr:ChrR family anti-sigma-E factor [Marinobacter sp. LV10MA510-1]PFG10062.1 ChrR-like anti-ECFsigma factor [Marinobacter sp. LV10MA510-1]
MTRHHPESTSLMEFSAGTLSDPHALCIRLHLEKCALCRSRVDTLESLGAVMLEQQPLTESSVPAASTFDAILARIDSETAPVKSPQQRQDLIKKLLGCDINDLPWKRQLGDVSMLDVTDRFPGQKERVVLQKLSSGGKAPAHTHRGTETTIVLQGAFSDNNGIFNQWDFAVLDHNDNHRPVAVGHEDCITLSVLSAPLKLTGTFTRLLNPFMS